MHKRIIFLLLIPGLIFSSELTKNYHFKTPKIKDGTVYIEKGRTLMSDFAPRVATRDISLLLPYGEKAVSLDVAYKDPIELDGVFDLKAFMPSGRLNVPPPQNYYRQRSEVYSIDAYYPEHVRSQRFYTHFKNGHAIFFASINPVQYNPVSGRIRYFKNVSISVKTEKTRAPMYKCDPLIKSLLRMQVDNPEEVDKLVNSKTGEKDYECFIVTLESLKDSWDEYIELNTRRALRTKVVSIDEINSSMRGGDAAERLKNYIKQEYENCNIKFVLLGGDDGFITSSNQYDPKYIPHRSYSATFKDYGSDLYSDTDIPADMYYETLDGEELEDLAWDVYSARFAVDDVTELNRMVNKSKEYSENPDEDACTRAILAGEEAWANINGGIKYGKDEMIMFKEGSTSMNGFTTASMDNTWTFFELYEKGGNWSAADLIGHINTGVNFLNHVGHSNNFMVMKLRTSDISKLVNTAYYIGYTQGCYCGAWDNRQITGSSQGSINDNHISEDCIAETFTSGGDGGAVVFISNTRTGLGDNGTASQDATDGSSFRYQRYFHDAVFGQKIHYLAMMMGYSKEVNKEEILKTDDNAQKYFGQMEYCAYQLTALGDPALSVWTKAPEELKKGYKLEDNKFTWNTKSAYTWIALCDKDDNILFSQCTGEDGKCEIEIDKNEALSKYLAKNSYETLIVRAKAHNYFPFEGEVDITDIINFADNNYSFKSTFTQSGKIIRFNYILPVSEFINLSIYNSKGMLLKTLINGKQNAGNHSAPVNTSDLNNGIYYCRLKSNNYHCTSKFIVTK